MSLSRRQIIEAGAATGALAADGSPAFAAIVDRAAVPTASPICASTISIRPRRAHAGRRPRPCRSGDRSAHGRPRPRRVRPAPLALRHSDVVGIADFTRPSGEPRFFLLDTNSGRVTRHLVAHGRGSDPAHTGFLQRFSNRVGSEASSNGAYVDQRLLSGPLRPLDAACAGSTTATATPRRGRSSSTPPGMPSPSVLAQQRPARPQRRLLRPSLYQPSGSARPPRPRPLPLRRPPRLAYRTRRCAGGCSAVSET